MNLVEKNIKHYRALLPKEVKLCAVSKFHPAETIKEAYDAGQRIFGESRVQELIAKVELLPADIEWHFIGHLQTNKVKYIVPFISLIQSVDSPKLIEEIDKCAKKTGKVVNCLLQLHVAQEKTKSGFTPQELEEYLAKGDWRNLSGVRFCGVMGMASFTDDECQIEGEFNLIRGEFEKIKSLYFENDEIFSDCSMGMSGDFELAIKCGSNIVRIGTSIFGDRRY